MNLVQYLHDGAPFTNLPDLLNLHHSNPLGLSLIAQLVIILVLVEVMALFNFFIRYRGKSQYYPVLYSLLGVSVFFIFYYCFQDGMPLAYVKFATTPGHLKPCIGWFCQREFVMDGQIMNLSWGIVILNIVLLTHVIYSLLCATMQASAQISVEGKMIEGKKWKEWKIGLFIALAGVAAYGITYYLNPYVAAWTLVLFQIALIGFVIYKIIADGMRCQNFFWGVLIGVTVYVGFLASMMLAIECLRGLLLFLVVIVSFLGIAKARKKKPKNKQVQQPAANE